MTSPHATPTVALSVLLEELRALREAEPAEARLAANVRSNANHGV